MRPGDRVLDVASGTGLSFPLLREAVGAQGQVVGIDGHADEIGIGEIDRAVGVGETARLRDEMHRLNPQPNQYAD